MTVVEVEFNKDAASMPPEAVFYKLHPECAPLWMKIQWIIKWLFTWRMK